MSLLAEVPIAVMTREEVRTRFAELEVAESARTGLAVSAKLYQVLGLLDPDADLVRANRELAGELTSGFYDYRSKQLVVASEAELSPRELRTAAHEYTHALQDQHFGIQRLLDEAGNSDARRAVRALLEGDAILTSALYTRSTLSPAEREELNRPPQAEAAAGLALLDRMPLVLRENLIFPYEHGPAFVMASILPALLQRQAIDTVLNQLLAEPPQSSAEILLSGPLSRRAQTDTRGNRGRRGRARR